MPEQLLDAYATTNDDGVPYLGNCTLVIGEGKVEFRHGRAKVPVSLAHLVARQPHVEIPALGAVPEGSLPVATPTPAPTVETGGELEGLRARVAELETALANAAATAQSSDAPQDLEVADSEQPPDGFTEVTPEVAAAIAHLEEEGEEVPEVETPETPNREGFEAQTADGQPRCQAAKGDGTQCSNPARDGEACQLAPHKKQLAAD